MPATAESEVAGHEEGRLLEKRLDRLQLAEQILNLIVAEARIDRARITPEATLQSLDVQSVDVVVILMAVEEKFGVYVPIDGGIADALNLASFVDNVADRILQ
ncbi:MAG: phosphopantetheine-binding protein, partial [Bradyrhizobium sp.]